MKASWLLTRKVCEQHHSARRRIFFATKSVFAHVGSSMLILDRRRPQLVRASCRRGLQLIYADDAMSPPRETLFGNYTKDFARDSAVFMLTIKRGRNQRAPVSHTQSSHWGLPFVKFSLPAYASR